VDLLSLASRYIRATDNVRDTVYVVKRFRKISGGVLSELLTVEEVALALKRGERTVRRWIATGILPSVKLATGGRYVTRETLEDFVRRGERRGRVA